MGLVHEFKAGRDDLSHQHEMFRGRTSVFADQVIVGNASLRLKNVQLTDAGTYQCYIITSKGKGNANLEYKTGGEFLLEKERKKADVVLVNDQYQSLSQFC
jgi:immune costimulatory protein B7-H4